MLKGNFRDIKMNVIFLDCDGVLSLMPQWIKGHLEDGDCDFDRDCLKLLDDLIDDLIEDSHDYNGEDLESTYGVHDVTFNPETDILGFSSYEVGVYNCLPGGTEDRFQELMQKWRDIFKKRGYTTSTVYHEKIV